MNEIIHGDCLEVLKGIEDNSIDSVVTDPPYNLHFMNKSWDSFKSSEEYARWTEQWARECLRVLKPGGYLLAFSGTRTYHALAWGVESAGFEIRDMIEWLYLSGFPKNMDISKQFDKMAGAEREVIGVSYVRKGINGTNNEKYAQAPRESTYITAPTTPLAKQWSGWGTALKPAHEPIVMARKPLIGTVCENVEKYGTGGINVDACRIPTNDKLGGGANTTGSAPRHDGYHRPWMDDEEYLQGYIERKKDAVAKAEQLGRFPANCITTDTDVWYSKYFNVTPQGISKKASKNDRNSTWDGGTIDMEERVTTDGRKKPIDNPYNRGQTLRKNHHPTVKPIALMEWLIRLVTPPNGIVLDPFAGSGSTLVAAKREGFSFIGIEHEAEYVEIARRRLEGNSTALIV